jgi:hypothetical protein
MITVEKLMIVERFLLEIENRFKFDLSFENVRVLYDYLKDVGRVTNLFFKLQEEYYNKFKDKDKLKEYHNKLMKEETHLDVSKIVRYIDWITDTVEDEEFKNIVAKNKFWSN